MFPMIALGLSMGCDLVRVGFEDSLYLPDGSIARDNAEMVEAAATMGRFFDELVLAGTAEKSSAAAGAL
jgi:3-keto-5-aminohexanoate cleavage enzyme